MNTPTWIFEKTPEMGGATGEAYTNPLLGTGMDPAAILAREALQNSADAQAEGQKVRVDLRRVELLGDEKAAFVKTIALKSEFGARQAKLKLPHDTCLKSLQKEDDPLELLFIEDYGTVGLHGAPFSSKSNFCRLLLSLGDGAKQREAAGSGGSYGYGKSVYSSNSRIRTVVAYSVFDSDLSGTSEPNHSRLMGCAYFNAHEFHNQEFSGRAWFGVPRNENGASPLVDAAAHAFAERLGFVTRRPDDKGTSLLIVDSAVTCDMLRASIEDWWWPRLLDDDVGLDVRLYDRGERVAPPRPRKRVDLRPFLECYDLAVRRAMPTGAHQKAGQLNKLHDVPLGEYGFTVVDDATAADEKFQERSGTIALIRKPRMVIEYMAVGGSQLSLPCVGSFVAAPDVDDTLKTSEPASHDKWDAKSARLDDLESPAEARQVVKAITQRLKMNMRQFAAQAAPQEPKQQLRLTSLERLLGGFFRPPTTKSGTGGGHKSDPITINFLERPTIRASGDSISTLGRFRVSMAECADREKTKVYVRVRCLVQEDEGISTEDPIAVSMTSDDIRIPRSNRGEVAFELTHDSKPVFDFESAPYAPDWTTQVQVHVEEV